MVEKAKKEVKSLEYMRQRDAVKVKGKFKYYESKGGTLKFPFRQYKKDPIEIYELTDERIYELPLGVARHLNKNCWYQEHKHQVDEQGIPKAVLGRKVQRCAFESLEFSDIDDLKPEATNVITVEFNSDKPRIE